MGRHRRTGETNDIVGGIPEFDGDAIHSGIKATV
jgi:hypothetical protein